MTIVQLVRRPAFMGIALLAAAGFVFVLVWFQPQKLVIDDEVDEALPGASSQASANQDREAALRDDGSAASKNVASAQFEVLGEGDFRALAHPVSGQAKVLEVEGRDKYLRLEDFMVENGPDLRVYLSAAASDSESAVLGSDFIDLGAIKGNVGDQNYRIPVGADLDRFKSAVIWCRRFSVGFAVAPITG
jgi:hypothetical protein